MTDNEIRAYARNAGLGPEEAAPWADALIGPFEAGRALRAGRSIDDVRAGRLARERDDEWTALGFSADGAAVWRDLGWQPQAAAAWARAGASATVATEWALPGDGARAFSLAEFLRLAPAGLAPDEVRALLVPTLDSVPAERRLVWARWNHWFIVGGAQVFLGIAERRVHQRRIREARFGSLLRSSLSVESIEREIGSLLDRCWIDGHVPAPGEDLIPARPSGWMPIVLAADLDEHLQHPLDMLSAALPFDVSLLRSVDDTGWDCLWRHASSIVELRALAASHGYGLSYDDGLIKSALGELP